MTETFMMSKKILIIPIIREVKILVTIMITIVRRKSEVDSVKK